MLKILAALTMGFTSVYAASESKLWIERKEDELLLPPYLRDLDGGILNVVSEHKPDQREKRSAKSGEWLDYGDAFSTPDRMSFWVLMNEGLQWVAGGVFDGKIVGGKWNAAKPEYELKMNRGWIKVWAKPTAFSGSMEIKTPKVSLVLSESVAWMRVSAEKTELYVLSGSVKGGERVCDAEKFCEWGGVAGPSSKSTHTSTQWDFVSLEHRIAEQYPNLIKLSHRANDDWLSDVSSKKYEELRSAGWRKAGRLFATPTPKK